MGRRDELRARPRRRAAAAWRASSRFSGFIPTVEGWEPDLAARRALPVLIAHGTRDPVIAVEFARAAARRLLEPAAWRSSTTSPRSPTTIDPRVLPPAAAWLARTLPAASGGPQQASPRSA